MFKFLKNIRQRKWVKILGNKYVLITVVFVGWMLFFDSNNFFIHEELNNEINELEGTVENYKGDIELDKEQYQKLQDSSELEKFAREQYYLKKSDEDIYIITHQDSIDDSNEQ